jgi:Fe-S cluster biogenesis protein NfuA
LSSPSNPDVLRNKVIQTLAEEIGPALQMDGAGIEVLDVTDGVVRVRLRNVCNGCPSTIMTVIMGLEQELRQRIPEVAYLEAEY